MEPNPKAPKVKVNYRVKFTKIIFSKFYTEISSREVFIINSVLKTNSWTNKIKYLNEEKVIRSIYEKQFLRSIL